MADDDSTPMSRTELAMLWDLLSGWMNSHPGHRAQPHAYDVRAVVDDELTDRFGG